MDTGKDNNTNASPGAPESGLEALFDAARASPPPLPQGLHARLVADAEAALAMPPLPAPGRALQARPRARPVPPARRQSLAAASGLLAAAAVGLWIGFTAPDLLADPLAGALPGVLAGFGIVPEFSAEDADLEVILLAFDDFLDEG